MPSSRDAGEHKSWQLVELCAQPNADTAAIDRRIWDLFGERWAVMFEVNAASKLGEDIAKADEILCTGAVKDAVTELPGLAFEDLDSAPPGAKSSFRVSSRAL